MLLPTIMLHAVHAQDDYASQFQGGVESAYASAPAEPDYGDYRAIPARRAAMTGAPAAAPATQAPAAGPAMPVAQDGYVYLGAPLYPSPKPTTPYWTGGAMITNQAFAPHEMLYPHTYRAIYPPYYHRVKGSWLWTPFGVRSHERWELQGTQVQVKYRSKHPAFPPFFPGVSH
ncbi:hypothetical protein [Planctellipticum variicoloris]|uniref:hypothetical protein n=1 Tax=Planctellipticum variicoloris TaxID=3064265 RepID=UPI003013A619|nr:hypothetical protein SH412_000170 [Planctomycetaceae bacterium SH412]